MRKVIYHTSNIPLQELINYYYSDNRIIHPSKKLIDKQNLIQLVLLGFPFSAITLWWKDQEEFYGIIDGYDEIQVMVEFITNKFKIKGSWLKQLLVDSYDQLYEENSKQSKQLIKKLSKEDNTKPIELYFKDLPLFLQERINGVIVPIINIKSNAENAMEAYLSLTTNDKTDWKDEYEIIDYLKSCHLDELKKQLNFTGNETELMKLLVEFNLLLQKKAHLGYAEQTITKILKNNHTINPIFKNKLNQLIKIIKTQSINNIKLNKGLMKLFLSLYFFTDIIESYDINQIAIVVESIFTAYKRLKKNNQQELPYQINHFCSLSCAHHSYEEIINAIKSVYQTIVDELNSISKK